MSIKFLVILMLVGAWQENKGEIRACNGAICVTSLNVPCTIRCFVLCRMCASCCKLGSR